MSALDARHRIRLATLVVDTHDLPRSTAFWSAVLGAPVATGDPSTDRYVSLGNVTAGLRLLLQRVPQAGSATNRMHFDIETDEPAAEVERILALGGQIVRPLGHGATVMRDPAGTEFCVIYPETAGWPTGTRHVRAAHA